MSAAKACQGDKSSDRRPTSRHIQPRGGRGRERRLMEACLREVSAAAAAAVCCDCDCCPSLQKLPGLYLTSSPPLVFNPDELRGWGLIQSLSIPLALSHFYFIYWEQKSSEKDVYNRQLEPLPDRTVGGRTDRMKNRLCPGRGVVSVTPSALYRQHQFYAGTYSSFSEIANICALICFNIYIIAVFILILFRLTPILSNLLINILFKFISVIAVFKCCFFSLFGYGQNTTQYDTTRHDTLYCPLEEICLALRRFIQHV